MEAMRGVKGEAAVNSFQELFDLIGELARKRYQAGERAFSSLGLNHTEARLLTLLDQEGGSAAQDALSNRLSVDRSNAVRALQGLEREGYVARRKDDSDKRANVVRMTAKGRKTVSEIGKLRKAMARSFFGELKEAEAGAVVGLLKKALADQEA
jgi:MarR family transcriptional regulator for hemolysin